jgi:DNA ligase 1
VKAFADLYRELDAATSTRRKQFALQSYLRAASADPSAYESAAWTVYFLAGGKPRQFVSTRVMREVSLDLCDLPEWLFEECRETVGDFAETLSLLLPTPQAPEEVSLAEWIGGRLPSLRHMKDAERAATLRGWIDVMPQEQRLVFFKLITGSFRVGVSKLNVVNALASVSGVDARTMAQRMMGFTQTARGLHGEDFASLLNPGEDGWRNTQPYPFFLAHPLQAPVEVLDELLGPPADWLVEWKFDGIRAQLLRRGGEWRLWSRGEELVNDAFPELGDIASRLPDGTALDGEIVVGRPRDAPVVQVDAIDDIAPFASLQRRLGRKALSAKVLQDLPSLFIAYDLLEMGGDDLRERPQAERRKALEALVERLCRNEAALGGVLPLRLSPAIRGASWEALFSLRETARDVGVEGMMLKPLAAPYGVGRRKGAAGEHWWKWKLDPMSVDAVMIYAQRGHGRRSGVYSDYTFALWDGEGADRALVPFAKAYSGLTDAEMRQVDGRIRKTTIQNYGPVRSLEPTMVFELGFEGIAKSSRHKSGVAVRFPRMLRWRHDKPVEEADTLERLRALLPGSGA